MAKTAAGKKRAETFRLKKLCSIEEEIRAQGYQKIAGVDEAGRGPLAGPVVAAACILPIGYVLRQINDSKKLLSDVRVKLYQELISHPEICFSIGVVEPAEIDELNILQASLKAMEIAVGRLSQKPDFIVVDGNRLPHFDCPATAVIDGDRLSQAIAAASIIAKVTRDEIMVGYDTLFPQYGFINHKGYGTKEHLLAIAQHGLSPIHRKSFHLKVEAVCEA